MTKEILKDYYSERLNLYRELTVIKENGKSIVSLVQNTETKEIFVKKVLSSYDINVYKIIKKLKSKNAPYIYEILEFDDKLILIEEYLSGNTLDQIIKMNGALPLQKVIDYAIQLCDLLEILHSSNPPIIHRDLTLTNILITNDGVLKLFDYDISRSFKDDKNSDTFIMGTIEFAAPEQFGFMQTDCRTDIYSVGVLMNVLSSLKYPKEEIQIGLMHDIIQKCVSFSPKDRYNNVAELKSNLKLVLSKIENKDYDLKRGYLETSENKAIFNKISKFLDSLNNKYLEKKKKYSYKPKNLNIKNFSRTLPGFRSQKISRKIIATTWYAFSILEFIVCLTNFTLDLLTFFFLNIILTIINTNYLNVRAKLPILKSKNIYKITFGLIVYNVLTLSIFAIVDSLARNL